MRMYLITHDVVLDLISLLLGVITLDKKEKTDIVITTKKLTIILIIFIIFKSLC